MKTVIIMEVSWVLDVRHECMKYNRCIGKKHTSVRAGQKTKLKLSNENHRIQIRNIWETEDFFFFLSDLELNIGNQIFLCF